MSDNKHLPAYPDPVFGAIADLSRLATDLVVMESIGLEKPLRMEGKCSTRLKKGDKVRVACMDTYPILDDIYEHLAATHEITECRGNLYNTIFEVDLRDLKTGELLTIKL